MASCLALRYALLALSPVSSQGMCFGFGIAWAAALFSPLRTFAELPLRGTLRFSVAGAGDGDIFTISASVLGATFSFGPCPWPPLLP